MISWYALRWFRFYITFTTFMNGSVSMAISKWALTQQPSHWEQVLQGLEPETIGSGSGVTRNTPWKIDVVEYPHHGETCFFTRER